MQSLVRSTQSESTRLGSLFESMGWMRVTERKLFFPNFVCAKHLVPKGLFGIGHAQDSIRQLCLEDLPTLPLSPRQHHKCQAESTPTRKDLLA